MSAPGMTSVNSNFNIVIGPPEQGLLKPSGDVNIKFVSTLTTEDENVVAPIALRAIASILDLFPIAYSIQIDTSDARIYQHSRTQPAKGTTPLDLGAIKAQARMPPRPPDSE